MRNDDGTFASQNKFAVGRGRPVGSGKQCVKDMVMAALERVVWLVFGMPEDEMKAWLEQHGQDLSVGERILVDASENLEVIEWLMDRVLGKSIRAEAEVIHRNPLIERLYTLEPGDLSAEIDALIRKRQIILDELSNP